MSKLKGVVLLGQSGGPTSVINASAAGVFLEALKHPDRITGVYGAVHGIKGILNEDFYDMTKEDPKELELLKNTPASMIGSVRYKLADPKVDDTDYKRLVEVFRKYNIRYFFYNGGNDSMDTAHKISEFMKNSGWSVQLLVFQKLLITTYMEQITHQVMVVLQNMLQPLMELYHDATVYDTKQVTIVEIMGRNAGWLTAASQLAIEKGQGPDLVYLPEQVFDYDKFFSDVEKVLEEKGKVIVAISEGVQDAEGKYIPAHFQELRTDSFGHAQLGGTATILAEQVQERLNVKVRAIEFSLMQRSGAHLASKVDVREAFHAGVKGVREALKGTTDRLLHLNVFHLIHTRWNMY